jgi:hypothetical protein
MGGARHRATNPALRRMTKSELYRRQGERAARTIAQWPRWMRNGITPPRVDRDGLADRQASVIPRALPSVTRRQRRVPDFLATTPPARQGPGVDALMLRRRRRVSPTPGRSCSFWRSPRRPASE